MVARDIMMAVLSLDTYSRGYDARNFDPDLAENGRIGNYRITHTSTDAQESDDFYALAYIDNVNGVDGTDRIIAYRGTDDFPMDAWYGYGVGAGSPGSPQGQHAIAFYEMVTGRDVNSTAPISNISLTGHSLGGGLAGYVAALSGANAVVFDNMPFRMAAIANAQREVDARSGLSNAGNAEDYGVRIPSMDTVKSYSLEHELLSPLRFSDDLLLDGYQTFFGYGPGGLINRILSNVGGSNQSVANLEAVQNHTVIEDRSGIADRVVDPMTPGPQVPLDMLTLHSQSLLVMQMFAEDEWSDSNWEEGAKYVLNHVFDDDIGTAVGRVTGVLGSPTATGSSVPGDQLSRTIAYSVVDEGAMPFGNVGIRAMMDDMDDLGSLAKSLGTSNAWFNAHADDLGRIAVNFAGRMAVGKVVVDQFDDEDEDWDPDADEDGPDVLGGAISIATETDYSSAELNTTLLSVTVDASRELWDQGLFSRSSAGLNPTAALVSSDNKQIVGLYDLHSTAIDEATAAGISLSSALVTKYSFTPLNFFETYTFVLGEGRYGMTFANDDEGLGLVKVEADVAITAGSFGDEVMQAWSGGSTLYGMGGNDLLVGGMGNDTLVGGASSTLLGGKGNDILAPEWGYTIGQTEAAFADGGEGFDFLSYAGAESVVVDAVNQTVTIGDRVDTFVNIESVEGGYGWNEYYGNGQMQFSGSSGNDTFFLKIGDSARGNSGFDIASFENVQGGISMSAGGILRNAVSGAALSHVNDVNLIIGTASADHFTGQNFDIFKYESLAFDGGQGADTFDLYNLNKAWGGEGADQFYIHLSNDPTFVNLDELTKEDSLFIVMGQNSLRLTGNSLSVSFRTDPVGTEGSYNLLEKVNGTSPFSADVPERYIGSYNAVTQSYLKDESVEINPSWGEHDFFEFSADYQSGIVNVKVDGFGELKILIDYVNPDDFGLEYTTLPGGDGSRYDGQLFNHANPTGSYSVDAVSFDDPEYTHLVGWSQLEQVSNEFIYL